MPAQLIRHAVALNLPIHTSYGLTEMASQVTTTRRNDPPEVLFSSGQLLRYRSLRVGPGDELLVSGETRFAGYVENEEIVKPFDARGWFATGDVGKIDADGNLTVLGRRDTMFISGGENIYPEEIEKALYQIAGIEQAVVVPVTHPEYGFRPVAFVSLSRKSGITPADLREKLRDQLPGFKIPNRIFDSAELSLAADLKPDRLRLQKLAKKLCEDTH